MTQSHHMHAHDWLKGNWKRLHGRYKNTDKCNNVKKRTSQGLEQTAEKHKTKQLKMALNHKDHNIEHRSRDTLSRISSERLSIWSGLNKAERLWLEGIELKPKATNKYNFLPLRLCFINVYTYPNPKPTPYNNAKTVLMVVHSDKK